MRRGPAVPVLVCDVRLRANRLCRPEGLFDAVTVVIRRTTSDTTRGGLARRSIAKSPGILVGCAAAVDASAIVVALCSAPGRSEFRVVAREAVAGAVRISVSADVFPTTGVVAARSGAITTLVRGAAIGLLRANVEAPFYDAKAVSVCLATSVIVFTGVEAGIRSARAVRVRRAAVVLPVGTNVVAVLAADVCVVGQAETAAIFIFAAGSLAGALGALRAAETPAPARFSVRAAIEILVGGRADLSFRRAADRRAYAFLREGREASQSIGTTEVLPVVLIVAKAVRRRSAAGFAGLTALGAPRPAPRRNRHCRGWVHPWPSMAAPLPQRRPAESKFRLRTSGVKCCLPVSV
jgi:hypothetical protein